VSSLPDFYLVSDDYVSLREPRACSVRQQLQSVGGVILLVVRTEPVILLDTPGHTCTMELEEVVLAPRHVGHPLQPVREWPVFVRVARLRRPPADSNAVTESDLDVFAWAEIYRTSEDATNRRT
jgi:hypothetical protein